MHSSPPLCKITLSVTWCEGMYEYCQNKCWCIFYESHSLWWTFNSQVTNVYTPHTQYQNPTKMPKRCRHVGFQRLLSIRPPISVVPKAWRKKGCCKQWQWFGQLNAPQLFILWWDACFYPCSVVLHQPSFVIGHLDFNDNTFLHLHCDAPWVKLRWHFVPRSKLGQG